jgi:LPS export ABC transporter protein LptC
MLPANVDMRLGNLVLNETSPQGRSLSVVAATAQYYKEEDYFLLQDVTSNIESPGTHYVITAKNGRYEPSQKLVTLTGSVRTADNKGRIITGPRMVINMTEGTFYSNDDFCLEDPTLSLAGTSFVYYTNTGKLEVDGRVFLLITEDLPVAANNSTQEQQPLSTEVVNGY